jgi:hypothetical protein
MGSPLDFINSDNFRKSVVVRNLKPYGKSPNRQTPPLYYEYIQSNYSVIDSPDELIDEPSFANRLYPLNEWGTEGGYKEAPGINNLLPRKSNQGEYGPGQQDAKIIEQALPESKVWKKINAYSDGTQTVVDGAEYIGSLDTPEFGSGLYNNQPYYTFVPSSYSPVSILLNPDPQGDNGLLSQDSYIVKLGAQTLKREFQERIAAQIEQDTVGRANVFSVDGVGDIVNILNGRVPLIEPNWTITAPETPILAATNFILRLAGSILPVSPIPGSYFDESINQGQPNIFQQAANAVRDTAVGNFFSNLLNPSQTGSELFYRNTGQGQKSRLFKNINYNKYRPSFDRTLFNRGGGQAIPSTTDSGNFYIGSITSDPSRVFSPSGDLPVNAAGQEQQSPVYGPSELSQLYEGPSKEIRLGANAPVYSDGGGIEGGLTWVSPKYKGNAGKKVGIGGEVTNSDEDFKPSSYNTTESTNIEFREGSILDDTQRIINSQPQGGRRLQHVGNAIDQVSKVFNDGYREITKGSKVLAYVGDIGQEVGTEYCRVFAKDTPYLQYNDLQKTDGTVTEGRRFSWSVLDKTYNLNIAPNKQEGGQNSTNLINGAGGTSTNVAYAKKYMFSLENLAWRTSSTPGYTLSDLPICERGPNGGRVMWFPPYGLTFNENVSANWKSNDFLGRPEPIYTYTNTQRTGSISWKIVVDHPSVLNLIVNKVLSNETNKTRVNSILESFFAGCRKYDLYELAKKYNTINPNDLFQIQKAIAAKDLTQEQLEFVKQTVETGNGSTGNQSQDITSNPGKETYIPYVNNLSYYFGNGYPYVDNQNYTLEFNRYTSPANIEVYRTKSPNTAEQTTAFFDSAVKPNFEIENKKFIQQLISDLENYPDGTITIKIGSSCSAPASINYNIELSKRRINSVITYFKENETLKKYLDKRLFVQAGTASGETATAQVRKFNAQTGTFETVNTVNCTDSNVNVVGGDTTVGSNEKFTQNAMACRRAFIESVDSTLSKTVPVSPPPPQTKEVLVGNKVEKTIKQPPIEQPPIPKDNITKKVLRMLLSECDYFETIKEETPMVFDNLRDKLKFFHPTFHSTTPEGLNSRLTFLQQCMRPGDTIPTIKQVDGNATVLEYNDAFNTAFGAPPVLVLRVGDFYNTKIIPTTLNLTYENLDLNPEGIGIQPMIANVTMNFNFVGGQGLQSAIDKLQNALTFNFYANTEMYDDRSDVTDESYQVIDKEFLDSIVSPPVALNQTEPNNGKSNQNTVGTIVKKEINEFETGTISYTDIMETLKTETQTYFQSVVNKTKELTIQYNNAARQQWMLYRNYTNGKFGVSASENVKLFGKPSQFEKNIDNIFKKLIEDIDDGNDSYLNFLSETSKNFSDKVIRQAKENYKNFVKEKKGTYLNGITKITQDLVNIEQSYINTLGKINTITFEALPTTGTDGFQQTNGQTVIYITSGASLTEIISDTIKVKDAIIGYDVEITKDQNFQYKGISYTGKIITSVGNTGKPEGFSLNENDIFFPFSKDSKFDDENFKRIYMIISDEILDDKKYETFKDRMIGNIINNSDLIGKGRSNIEEVFDSYWITNSKPTFKNENEITISFIDDMISTKLKDYFNFTPYEKKERVLDFTSENGATDANKNKQKKLIIGLGSNMNISSDFYTWNDNPPSTSAETLVSKAKMN